MGAVVAVDGVIDSRNRVPKRTESLVRVVTFFEEGMKLKVLVCTGVLRPVLPHGAVQSLSDVAATLSRQEPV